MTAPAPPDLARLLEAATKGPLHIRAARLIGDYAVCTAERKIIGEAYEAIRHADEKATDEARANAQLFAMSSDLGAAVVELTARVALYEEADDYQIAVNEEVERLMEENERLQRELSAAVAATQQCMERLEQARKDSVTLIANLDHLAECFGEGPEGDDAAAIADISARLFGVAPKPEGQP